MKRQEFEHSYNPANRCVVTYRDKHGYTVRGLLLDDVKTSTCGVEFVHVNNFINAVRLADVVAVRDTGAAWSKA